MPRREQRKEPAAIYVSTSDLVPWAGNPRLNDSAVQAVADSIQRFGFGAPLVARQANGEVIAGHTRLKAAILLGLESVPVRYLDLDEAEAHALSLADNKLGELADWNDEALRAVITDLVQQDVDLASMGWSDSELDKLVTLPEPPPYSKRIEAPIYEPHEPAAPPVEELFDRSKADELTEAILVEPDLPADVRAFLLAAAQRHVVFRYDRIAEFYAHAPAHLQNLMEASALVIIDFGRAIEEGFATMSREIAEAYLHDTRGVGEDE